MLTGDCVWTESLSVNIAGSSRAAQRPQNATASRRAAFNCAGACSPCKGGPIRELREGQRRGELRCVDAVQIAPTRSGEGSASAADDDPGCKRRRVCGNILDRDRQRCERGDRRTRSVSVQRSFARIHRPSVGSVPPRFDCHWCCISCQCHQQCAHHHALQLHRRRTRNRRDCNGRSTGFADS